MHCHSALLRAQSVGLGAGDAFLREGVYFDALSLTVQNLANSKSQSEQSSMVNAHGYVGKILHSFLYGRTLRHIGVGSVLLVQL